MHFLQNNSTDYYAFSFKKKSETFKIWTEYKITEIPSTDYEINSQNWKSLKNKFDDLKCIIDGKKN